MKKLLFLLVFFVLSFFLFTKLQSLRTTSTSKADLSISSTPTPTPIPVGKPTTISIPAIGVNTTVESVGMDSQGRMGVPETSTDTAWYKLGYKPGEIGSAVIDGHFDTVTGAPAVFYNLSKLKPGDTITVTDSLSNTYTFDVTQVISYPDAQVPLQQIFATKDKPRLNLITCDGTWNRTVHNYSNRAVVYSVLEGY